MHARRRGLVVVRIVVCLILACYLPLQAYAQVDDLSAGSSSSSSSLRRMDAAAGPHALPDRQSDGDDRLFRLVYHHLERRLFRLVFQLQQLRRMERWGIG